MPNLRRMKDEGKWTLKSRSCLPSSSAINWATIMMGANSELHGYRQWNSKVPDLPSRTLTAKGKFPCIFSLVREQKPEAFTCSAWNWNGIAFIHETNDVSAAREFKPEEEPQEFDWIVKELAEKKPLLAFMYLDNPDGVGHKIGWGTKEYHEKMTELDGYIGRLRDFLEKGGWMEDTVVVFVSDHGGKDKGHGGQTMDEMETSFILWGAGIPAGEMKGSMMGMDVSPTIADLLGLATPDVWRGKSALNR